MEDPSTHDGRYRSSSEGPRRPGAYPVIRAGLVLAAFVVAVVLLLATIHPTRPAAEASATAGASTTAPAGSATTAGHGGHGATTTTAPPRPPANVPVLVANGAGVTNAATAFSARLQQVGWTTAPPINATMQVTASHVYYVAGQHSAAAQVAAVLHIPSTSVVPYTTAAPISAIGTADVVVVLGPDIATTATVSTAPTTTTTAAGSTAS